MRRIFRCTGACLVFILLLTQSAFAQLLVPVGEVIGIELADGSVTIAAFDDVLGANARQEGLQVGDQITMIDDTSISSVQDVRHALERSDGTAEVWVLREGRTKKMTVQPSITSDGPKLGLYLKQGVTGVGTVTWYDPDTGRFGALGHGVNTAEGELLDMEQGKVYRAAVLSVKKGTAGDPGQLMGTLKDQTPIGSLSKNTSRGIFGTVQTGWDGQTLSVATAQQIQTGPAVIRSTVQGDTVQEYSVEILKIYPNAGAAERNMLLKVTDPALLNTTGGIVQGMSGSPLVQDGKLIGAVTHVLVNDPTMGYGIFIENMLEAAG